MIHIVNLKLRMTYLWIKILKFQKSDNTVYCNSNDVDQHF